jgi:hypothetical protein
MKNYHHLSVKGLVYLFSLSLITFGACSDEESPKMPFNPGQSSYVYAFNEGQLLDNPETAYSGENEGDHPRN